jgi:hypothetical protein
MSLFVRSCTMSNRACASCSLLANIAMSSAHVGATTLIFPIVAPRFDLSKACKMVLLYLLYRTVDNEAQALLDIVHDLTNRDIVTINPLRSNLVPLTRTNREFSVKLGKNQITQKTETKHLNIENRLKITRRTVYALVLGGHTRSF